MNLKGQSILSKDGEVLYFPGFFDQEESDRLFKSLCENIDWQQDKIKFFGKVYDVPRLTALYGNENLTYTYSGIQMKPHPWTPDLLKIKVRIEEVAMVSFTSVLLNLYRNGQDSNGWHSDNERELGINPVIGSVSFGAARTFKLRHLQDKTIEKVELDHGSFLLMRGETQHKWEHQIPKTSRMLTPRINLTYRVIR
jgi:alkylated DNA repair dioxygenase AlkB